VRLSDPAVSKVGEPREAGIGEQITWTITVWNPGSTPTYPVVLSDSLPSMFDIIDVTTSRGTVTINGNTITIDIGVMQPGETVIVQILTVANELATPGDVCNTAFVGMLSAEACITMYPGVLPETGGGPLSAVWWAVGGLAGGGAAVSSWLIIRRRRRLLGRFP
jgi:uncharacterized repeat protein (TIGR01451 family)